MIPREDVKNYIGLPFVQEKDGYAWGCLAPFYQIHPEFEHIKAYRYPVSEDANMLKHFKSHFKEVNLEDAVYGDVLVIKLPMNQWHLAVYLGDGKLMHCTLHIDTEITRLENFSHGRIKGVFRCHTFQQQHGVG